MPFGSTPGVVIKDDGTPVLSPAAAINCGSGLSASDDGAGQVTLTASGGTAEPGGTNGQIQYNNAGALGGLDSTGTGNPVRENSPTLTGTPAAPTAAPGTDTTQIATTAFVKAAVLASNYIDGEVETHADLPVTVGTPAVDSAYLVRESTGLWLINRKPAGIWVRLTNDGDLDDWSYAGTFPNVFSDANFSIYDNGDTSKELGFSLGGITTGQKRILTPLDKNYTVEETGHAAKHTDGTDDIQSATASQKGLATAAQITKLDGIEAAADVTDAGNVGAAIHGATGKTTPVDADTLALIDSEASNVLKKLTWANLKATAKTYFDTLYLALVAPGASGNVLTSNGSAWTSAAPTGGGGTDIFTFGTLEVLGVFGGSTLLSNLPYRSSAVGSGTLTQYVGNDFSALEIRTGTTSGWGHYWFYSANSGTYNIYDLDETHTWKMQFLIRPGADITDFRLIVGAVAVAGTATPVDGIGVRFDTSLGDSNFRLVAWASSTPTLGSDNLGAVAANTVYTVKIWSTGDGTIRATVNGGTESTLTTGITSVRVNPIFQLINSGAADKRAQLARFALRIEGLSP